MNTSILNAIERIKNGDPNIQDLTFLLALENADERQCLYESAYEVKTKTVGKIVRLRGLIEFSNVCRKNCFYCGIRRDNTEVERYTMSVEEIEQSARWIYEQGYGSVVLQSGELTDPGFVDFVEDCLWRIKSVSGNALGITLSLGEQDPETYQRWFQAGAHRYLLRIETSNPVLYQRLHPDDHDFNRRLACLDVLRQTGYQVGTGVMIGLPGQTIEDLARDTLFFKDHDIDMIGMGPYIPHGNTPLGKDTLHHTATRNFMLSLNMIACVRLCLYDVNIAATTALQALDPEGREQGLLAGANVMMPNITDVRYREAYKLYEGKPCTGETAAQCQRCFAARINKIGEQIGYNEWGDSPHFSRRTGAR